MKKGFTLVELSIVLVIIGMLIGGILIGQSLIESARMNKVINTASQFQIMVALFKEKTRYLPGDAGAAAGIPVNLRGNLDNLILSYENRAVMAQLAALGMYQSSNTSSFYDASCRPGPSTTSVDCYIKGFHKGLYENTSNEGKSIFMLSSSFLTAADTIKPYPTNGTAYMSPSAKAGELYISYGTAHTQSNTPYLSSIFTPLETMSIDKKLDDGIATTGKVLGHPGSSGCAWPGCDCIDDGNNRDGAIQDGNSYNLTKTTPQCAVIFHIGTGNQLFMNSL